MGLNNGKYQLYWGDLHNHNSAGTAKGSMERTLDIAKSNLDFYAFTGQSQWHDMKEYKSGAHLHWLKGFKDHLDQWPKNKQLLEEANEDGRFVAFVGYEWHSSAHGDYNIYFPDDQAEFRIHPTMEDLANWARQKKAMIIPHHLGYPTGHRGANWDTFINELSPVVEIISEHGGCERDEGPFPYIRHGLGARMTSNTYQAALDRGLIIGAIGGTDNHIGFPGGYGEGLTAILAEKLDRASIMDAIWKRRTYAVSGDRIGLHFAVNGHVMGEMMEATKSRSIEVAVNGWDRIRSVELLKNNQVIHHHTPERHRDASGHAKTNGGREKVKFRLEFGWGPWGDLNMARICDWDIRVRVENGRILDTCPCFGSGPFDEERRSKWLERSETSCHWLSYTRRQGAFEERPNGVVFELEGDASTRLVVNLKLPYEREYHLQLADIREQNASEFVGDFQSEMIYFHRIVPESEYNVTFTRLDEEVAEHDSGRKHDFYRVRVLQDNGQMAWSSPIWVATS